MRWVLPFLCVFTFSLSAGSANAWNDVGHMAVARIAYEKLTDGERSAIVAILQHHPHLRELLLKDRPPEATKAEWIFLKAATWPDNVRPPRDHERAPVSVHPVYRFHHPAWHFANFEIRSGQHVTRMPDQPLPSRSEPGQHHDPTNIIEQLDHSYLIVRGRERELSPPELECDPSEIRAIRLCWLFHLMGDIHQPLHVATLFNPLIPELQHGDEGGNKLAVRLNHHSAPRKLHAVWDDVLGTNPRYEKIVQLAERLSHDPRLSPSRMPEFVQHRYAREFAEESFQIAHQVVYQEGHLSFAIWSRLESHQFAAENVPVLPEQFMQHAHALAERRIALAGYRLAERLRYIVQHDDRPVESIGFAPDRSRRVIPSRYIVR